MKNLRILITLLFLIATLSYTLMVATPILGNAPTAPEPDVPCEGHVCWWAYSCLYLDPTEPYYHCTNWCYSGGKWKCLGSSSCLSYC